MNLEEYLEEFKPKVLTGYVAIDTKEDTKEDTKAHTKDIAKKEDSHEFQLFQLACSIVGDKWVFILWLLAIEFVAFLATISLLYQYKILAISLPILLGIMKFYFQNYKVEMMFIIKRKNWCGKDTDCKCPSRITFRCSFRRNIFPNSICQVI
jgi:hypothetical protein